MTTRLAVGEAEAVGEQLDGRVGGLVELHDRPLRELQRRSERQVRAPELGPDAHEDAAQDLASLGRLARLRQVGTRAFQLAAAELGVGVSVNRRLAGGGQLDGSARAASPRAPAPERDALGEQQHAVLGAVAELQQRSRA